MQKNRIKKKFYENWYSVAQGVWGIRDLFVNIYLVHNPSDNTWVLVDTGFASSASKIGKVGSQLFWPEIIPTSIILTHAHFDHAGSVAMLAGQWNIPVYAHPLEEPFLTGRSPYPPPDPSAGGGLLSLVSWAFPRAPIDISTRLKFLPEDGRVPGLSEWRYIHTPGHTPGHISLFREKDRLLIAGDVFVTTTAESLIATVLQTKKISGPPKYFTSNWISAEDSLKRIVALHPRVVATGHGKPMTGEKMEKGLQELMANFHSLAIPNHGRYSDDPAMINSEGVQYIPPEKPYGIVLKAAIITAVALTVFLLVKRKKPAKSIFAFSKN